MMGWFIDSFQTVSKIVNSNAHKKGFWDKDHQNKGEKIALMHSELSEALEYLRHGNPKSDHLDDFSGVEEELADVIIRIMDFAEEFNYDVANAIIAKIKFNEQRPPLHNKKF